VRKSRRISKNTTEDIDLDKEGVMYEAGAFQDYLYRVMCQKKMYFSTTDF